MKITFQFIALGIFAIHSTIAAYEAPAWLVSPNGNMKRYEKPQNTKEKQKILLKAISNNRDFKQNVFWQDVDRSTFEKDIANRLNYFHIVDINSDGQEDIIYTGGAVMGGQFSLWLNKRGNYVYSSSFSGEIFDLFRYKNGMGFRAILPPCCAGYITEIQTYRPNQINGNVKFVRIDNLIYTNQTQLPTKINKAKPITLRHNKTPLRFGECK